MWWLEWWTRTGSPGYKSPLRHEAYRMTLGQLFFLSLAEAKRDRSIIEDPLPGPDVFKHWGLCEAEVGTTVSILIFIPSFD